MIKTNKKINKRISCDNCGFEFAVKKITFHHQIIDKDKDVKITFFRCPKCKRRYITLVSDPMLEQLISEKQRTEAVVREEKLKEKYKEKIEIYMK